MTNAMIRTSVSTRRTGWTMAAGVAVAATVPLLAAAPAHAATPGWHAVQEPWTSVTQEAITYPAAKYCGTFDLSAVPISQDIKAKVLNRWDNGTARQTVFAGPLTERLTNTSTGANVTTDVGGTAIETDRADGSIAHYLMLGPVGVGMPIGTSRGLAPGVYRVNGVHQLDFATDGTRTMSLKLGSAVNECTALG